MTATSERTPEFYSVGAGHETWQAVGRGSASFQTAPTATTSWNQYQ